MTSFSNQSRDIILCFDEKAFYQKLVSALSNKNVLLVSNRNDASHDSPNNLKQPSPVFEHATFESVNKYLGLETDALFFDASNQFNVNAFTAICGSLVGGGELFLLLEPSIKKAFESNQFCELNSPISKTLLRFLRLLSTSFTSLAVKDSQSIYFRSNTNLKADSKQKFEGIETSQKKAVEAIKRCAVGHARRPIVLSANRGRGKSSSLGIATAELLFESENTVYITAPRKQQLDVFYRHLQLHLNKLTSQKHAEALVSNKLIFLPPDRASEVKQFSGLLIVEEAGALPTQLLRRFLENSNRTVYSTTIDGYEGNGQGFEIRFKKMLEVAFPQYKSLNLTIPVRWCNNDLLEKTLNHAFLMDGGALSEVSNICYETPVIPIEYRLIDQQQLFDNELLLASIYRLLVNAHYQTRPSDLEKILTQENLRIFVAMKGKIVIAASLACIEGRLKKSEINKIIEGFARIPGQLLPQSLIVHQGITQAASLVFLRIMRIAVNTKYRRQGIASQLLRYIEKFANNNQVNLLGTSFALFTDVTNFWYANGFAAIRIGIRKDSSSGAHTGEFLKITKVKSHPSSEVYKSSIGKFNQSFSYLTSSSLKSIPSNILLNISLKQPMLKIEGKILPEQEAEISQEVNQYLSKKRSLEMVEWQLYLLAKQSFFGALEGNSTHQLEPQTLEDYELIFAKVIQRKTWDEIVSQFKFKGIKQSREKSRLCFQTLLTLSGS